MASVLVIALLTSSSKGRGHEHGVVGLDLGTENSVVAIARRGGIDVIANEQSFRQSPSCLAFGGRRRLFGAAALSQIGSNGPNTIREPSALVAALSDAPLTVRLAHRSTQGRQLLELELTPLQIATAHVGHLLRLAAADHGAPLSEVCIAVPADWTARQRRVFATAAEANGARCLQLVPGDTAALLALAVVREAGESSQTLVALVDAGHSGVRICIARVGPAQVHVLARAQRGCIGGRALTRALADRVAERWLAAHGVDARAEPRMRDRLLRACARAKHALSASSEATVALDCLTADTDASAQLTRSDLELTAAPLLARVEALCARALALAGVSAVEAVELIGGASRTPALASRVASALLGPEPPPPAAGAGRAGARVGRSLNDAEAIARGAALAGAGASPQFRTRPLAVRDRLGTGLALSWGQPAGADGAGQTVPLASAGAELPCELELELPRAAAEALLAPGCGGRLLLCVSRSQALPGPCRSGALSPPELVQLQDRDEARLVAEGAEGAEEAGAEETLECFELAAPHDAALLPGAAGAEGGAAAGMAAGLGPGTHLRLRVRVQLDLCGDVALRGASLSWTQPQQSPAPPVGEAAEAAQEAAARTGDSSGPAPARGQPEAEAGGDAEAEARAAAGAAPPEAGPTPATAAAGLGADRGGGSEPPPSEAGGLRAEQASPASGEPTHEAAGRQVHVQLEVRALRSSAAESPAEVERVRSAEQAMLAEDVAEERATESQNWLEALLLRTRAELEQLAQPTQPGQAAGAEAEARGHTALRSWLELTEQWLADEGARASGDAHAQACEARTRELQLLRIAVFPSDAQTAQTARAA